MFEQPFLMALAVSAGVAIAISVLGGVLTDLGSWYRSLKQPSWKPPDWAFGPIWTVILALAAYAAASAWAAAPTTGARIAIVVAQAVNCVLHVAWSGIFFKLKRPDWAFVEVLVLWVSIAALIAVFGAQSPLAGWLLVPYLLWVATAAYLNWRVIKLNGPFGQRHER